VDDSDPDGVERVEIEFVEEGELEPPTAEVVVKVLVLVVAVLVGNVGTVGGSALEEGETELELLKVVEAAAGE